MVNNDAKIKKILVVGDAMLDVYHFGEVNRISPEAPVPVFLEIGKKRFVPGGAANVAVNIAAVGLQVSFCAVIGNDDNGRVFLKLMHEYNVCTDLVKVLNTRKTITKSRYIGPGNQQILRVDDEQTEDVLLSSIMDLMHKIDNSIQEYGVIVLSDYKKGFLTEEITQRLIQLANENNISVIVDVKDIAFWKYRNATILKPNRKELNLLTGMKVESKKDVVRAATYLCRETSAGYVLATLGAEGMVLADKNGLKKEIESTASEVFDVTGAGDTSVAYLVAEMVAGADISDAMVTANYAAGIQVSKVGTSIVYPYEVYNAMYKDGLTECRQGDYFEEDRIADVRRRKERGERIVFTNGCFDILHKGHLSYLREAKKMGDVLVVGLNSDYSVKRLKGDERPINQLMDREMMLSALSFVDYVIPFEEDTPIKLIKAIVPDILVKGGDYKPEDIIGAEIVLRNGGQVKVIPFVEGYSTSGIIKRYRKSNTVVTGRRNSEKK